MIECACERGWIRMKPGSRFFEACAVCRMRGVLTENRVSMLLGVSKSSIALLLSGRGRPRRRTCERILDGALALETRILSGSFYTPGRQVEIR